MRAFEKAGPDLVVRVVENPIINRVLFEGNRALDDDKLREEVQAAPRGIFTAARVQADVQRILELYRQSGRFSATVEPQYKPLDQNRVDLVFVVTEGPVTGVRAINFIGNDEFTDRRLRSEVVTKQSRWWRFFSSNDNYDPGRLEYDRELLRQFYQNRGYYDFRVISAVADLTPDREDFYITYTIEEGEQYTFGDVQVETALDKLSSEGLRRADCHPGWRSVPRRSDRRHNRYSDLCRWYRRLRLCRHQSEARSRSRNPQGECHLRHR